MTEKQPEEMRVPLHELLEDIPEDFRIGFKDNDNWSAGVTWHPIGVMCHQASAELRRLHEVNAELLEALKNLYAKMPTHPANLASYHARDEVLAARAAIAKATGEQ